MPTDPAAQPSAMPPPFPSPGSTPLSRPACGALDRDPALSAPHAGRLNDTRYATPILLALLVFCSLSLAAAITSRAFLEADACMHYIYARWALTEPHFLTNVWGRPFCTGIYAVPAVLAGRLGVRVMSMLLAVGTALFAWRIAQRQGQRWPQLALIFVLAQPLVFLHSFSELTELPFALLMALGFWAYQRRSWAVFALVAGMLPTSRPEGFGFVILAGVGLILHRRARWLALLIAPLAVWSVAGWITSGCEQPWPTRILLWVPQHWPYASTSVYEPGPLLLFRRNQYGTLDFSFFASLPAIVSPFVFPAFVLGVWLSFREGEAPAEPRQPVDPGSAGASPCHHLVRCRWLIALIPLMVLAGHSYLYWRGKMSSSGELRYMLVAAPFWGLVAARGWEWIFDRCRLRGVFLWAGVAAILPIGANVVWRCIPIRYSPDWVRAEEVAQWYRSTPLLKDYPRLMACHPGIHYFGDINLSDKFRTVEWHRKNVVAPPDGTILIWDPMYGVYNSDTDRCIQVDEIKKAGWVLWRTFKKETHSMGSGMVSRMAQQITRDEVGEWYLFLSPRNIRGAPTAPATQP